MYVWVETGELREDGKPKRERRTRAMHNPVDDRDLPTVEEVTQAIYATIDDYNFNHVHSALRSSPMDAHDADPTPSRHVGLAALWDFAIPVGTKPVYKVERRGVWIDYARWDVKGLVAPNEWVSVRQLPGINPRFLIGTPDGRYIGEVTPSVDVTEVEREERLERNRLKAQRLRDITKASRENSVARATAQPGTGAHVSDTSAKKLRIQAEAPLADPRAALSVPARSNDAA
jgi:hypothetical protein